MLFSTNFFRFPREGYVPVIGSRLYFLIAAVSCKYGEFAVKNEIAKFFKLSQKKPLRETFSKITIKVSKEFAFSRKPEKSEMLLNARAAVKKSPKIIPFQSPREEKRFIFSLSSPPPPLL